MTTREKMNETYLGKYAFANNGFANGLIGIIEKNDPSKFPLSSDFVLVTKSGMRQSVVYSTDITVIEEDDYPKYGLQYSAKLMAERLEEFENLAYAEGFGMDWYEDVATNLRKYLANCDQVNTTPTIVGLFDHIKAIHEKAME